MDLIFNEINFQNEIIYSEFEMKMNDSEEINKKLQ
jgi:hypothetical protein